MRLSYSCRCSNDHATHRKIARRATGYHQNQTISANDSILAKKRSKRSISHIKTALSHNQIRSILVQRGLARSYHLMEITRQATGYSSTTTTSWRIMTGTSLNDVVVVLSHNQLRCRSILDEDALRLSCDLRESCSPGYRLPQVWMHRISSNNNVPPETRSINHTVALAPANTPCSSKRFSWFCASPF